MQWSWIWRQSEKVEERDVSRSEFANVAEGPFALILILMLRVTMLYTEHPDFTIQYIPFQFLPSSDSRANPTSRLDIGYIVKSNVTSSNRGALVAEARHWWAGSEFVL